MATIISEFDDDELVVPQEFLPMIEEMFEFTYNRADEFKEGKHGVLMSISGGLYPEELGDKAQLIYEKVAA